MENPSFHLEAVVRERNELQDFEGPLSLILMLLQKNKIEIRDLRIADILDQYLAWLDEMQRMDLEVASEFVQMAAHLLYLKTRTLLSADEEVSELEVLLQSLEQLKAKDAFSAIQQVTPELKKASETGLLYCVKRPEPLPKTSKEYTYRHEPVDLLRALLAVYSRGVRTPEEEDSISRAIPHRIAYSIRDKSREILARLRRGTTTLGALYAGCASRSEVVATFVSVLEMCSLGSVRISRQDGDYVAEFVGGDVDEILEKIADE
ncbi:MAG: segregation/condensation protein A [Eubacteriales bacterium]|nr:segregation/condensation protein A [Eubacteriales bacterium]